MEIIVSNIFLDKLTAFRKNAFSNEDDNKILLSSKITRLLNSNINIVTNITEEEVDRCFTSNLGEKEYKTIKDTIIHKLIKNGYDYDEMNDISKIDCKTFLFTDNTCLTNIDDGIIELNFDKNKSEFYLDSMLTQRTFTNEYEEIKQYIPPCNCMLYIDPYLLEGKAKERKVKNENFKKLIHSFINGDLNVKFHLTILTKLGQFNYHTKEFVVVPEENINDLKTTLDEDDSIEYNIYLIDQLYYGKDYTNKFRDRIFFTNYTKGSIGHPNEEKTTYFNQNFMAISTDINRDYNDFFRELKYWQSFINRIPEIKYETSTKYGNLRNGNRIFKEI